MAANSGDTAVLVNDAEDEIERDEDDDQEEPDNIGPVRGRLPVEGREPYNPLAPYSDFVPVNTVMACTFSMLASFGMILSVFIVPAVCDIKETHHGGDTAVNDEGFTNMKCPVLPFSLIIYSHAAYWTLHLIVDPYLKYEHRQNRMRGYLLFYNDTKNIRRAPFYVVSIGNFSLVMADVILNDYCYNNPGKCTNDRFMRVDWLRGLITVEALTLASLFGYYLHKVVIFNRLKPKPDVMRPEIMYQYDVSLTLKIPDYYRESTEEEETHVAGQNRDIAINNRNALGDMEYIYGDTWKEEDASVRIMQAEYITFLIRQIRRKNRKIVTLSHHLSRFTDDVGGLVGRGIEYRAVEEESATEEA